MGRRSDHTRAELEALFVDEGLRQMAAMGLSRFSARDVAKRVGYSIGSLYNVFGSYDGLILAINARTLGLWTAHVRDALDATGPATDRIAVLVRAYFDFATRHPRTWMAIYQHHMADDGPAPDWYRERVAELMTIIVGEIAAVLPTSPPSEILGLARSLVATVHGHCVFSLYKTFDLLGETAPVEAALARVREAIAARTASAGIRTAGMRTAEVRMKDSPPLASEP